MPEARYKVKNWHEFQHYHQPRPKWIKLHRALLDDHEFHSLEPHSRALLVMLWLIAAESADGTIPSHKEIAWRLRMKERDIDSQMPVLAHFLEQVYSQSIETIVPEEKRREEREGEKLDKPAAKTRHLDFVLLTTEEHEKLQRYLNGNADEMIARLNDYIGSKGVKYKSHYHTIMNWWRKDHQESAVSHDGPCN